VFDIPDLGAITPADRSCGFQKFDLKRVTPELLLVLDRSSSMKIKVPGGTTNRWVDATAAVDEAIMRTQADVHWGLKVFPTGQRECAVGNGVEVSVRPDNHAMISTAIKATMPEGSGTPTQAAIRAGVAYLKQRDSTRPQFIVLTTDGYPNCRGGSDKDGDDAAGAVAAVKDAVGMGIQTFVIGLGTAASEHMVLNDLATAGMQARPGETKYYPAANRADLVTTLETITGKISSCVFALDKAPPSPEDVAVDVDGVRLSQDPAKAQGWAYGADGKSIELLGTACDALKTKGAKVEITFGCPGVLIP
jgi:hypothetical protein